MSDPLSTDEQLSPRLRLALDECLSYSEMGKPYHWRQASMRELEKLGLVKRYPNDTRKNPAWKVATS